LGYEYKPERQKFVDYVVEQVSLPANLPYTNKDFIKFKPETGKILQVKRLGESNTKLVFMYEANSNKGKYIDNAGNEYFMSVNSDGTFNILNEQKLGSQTETLFLKPAQGTTIIPSPEANISKAIEKLAQEGYQVQAIFGTGAIQKASAKEIFDHKTGNNPFVAESTFSKGKYNIANGEIFIRNSTGKNMRTRLIESNKETSKAGFYTKNDGSIHYLNLEGLSNQEVLLRLKKLRQNQNILSYSLNMWSCKENLNSKQQIAQARFAMVFDKNGKYISTMLTPPVGYQDVLTIAKAKFGNDVLVNQGDGDFYTGAFNLTENTFFNKPEMYFSNSAFLLVRQTANPTVNTLLPREVDRLTGVAQLKRNQDKIQNTIDQFLTNPIGTLNKIITHSN
jgi:hypothetical protein